jgi:hypothetical protein
MTVALSDIASAVTTYLEKQVTIEITKVTAHLQKNETGFYTVTATNASAPDGVKVTELAFHITVDDDTVIDLLGLDDPAGLHTTRETANPNSAVVVEGDAAPSGEMCVFFNGDNGVLDVGQSRSLKLEYKTKKPGTTTIKAHPHGTVDESTLFPPNQPGDNQSHDVTVLT